MSDLLKSIALKIPQGIRDKIKEEQLIETAVNIQAEGTPMEYLFDVYEEFIDVRGEHDDWNCWQCRAKVLTEFRRLKLFL